MFKTGMQESTAQGQTNSVANRSPRCPPQTHFGKEQNSVSFYEENYQNQNQQQKQNKQNQNQQQKQKQQNNKQNQNQNQNQF